MSSSRFLTIPWPSAEGALDAIFDHDALRHTTVASLRDGDGFVPLAVSPVGHPERAFATQDTFLERGLEVLRQRIEREDALPREISRVPHRAAAQNGQYSAPS